LHFKLPNLPSQIASLHYKKFVKKKMIVELCVGNYETFNGLVNGAYGIFKDFIKIISKSLVWINFQNPWIKHNT
jgi:hypothetical protein